MFEEQQAESDLSLISYVWKYVRTEVYWRKEGNVLFNDASSTFF